MLLYDQNGAFFLVLVELTQSVCTYHQNAKLLVDALNVKCDYKDLLAKMVCLVERKECMLGQCDDCPGKQPLIDYIYELVGDFEDDLEIKYKQWQTTDRANLSNLTADVITFIDIVVQCFKSFKHIPTLLEPNLSI